MDYTSWVHDMVCNGSPRSRDNDGNKFETLLFNPPVEQNLIHGSFCNGDDCYATKPKADEEVHTRTAPSIPAATSTTCTSIDGCKRFVDKIISSFDSSPIMEELRSLSASDKDGITKKSAATLPSHEVSKPAESENGKENNLPDIDISCMRKPITSNDGENDNGVVRLPVVRRIFRFYVLNNPPAESVPSDTVKEEKLVLHPIVQTEEPKVHSAIINEPRVIWRKIPQPAQSNFHVFPLLTPVSLNGRNDHFADDVSKRAEAINSIYHLLQTFDNNVYPQNLNYVTPPAMEHVTPARVQSYASERPMSPDVTHLTNTPPALPIPLRPVLYRFVVKEPFHVFGDPETSGTHLHRIYPSEATVPVSQWWYPLSSPVYSKQVYFVSPNHGQNSPSGYAKKETPLL